MKFDEMYKELINYIHVITYGYKSAITKIQLPNQTKILMSAMLWWVYIQYYITKIFNKFISLFLTYIPDSLVIFNPFNHVPDKTIHGVINKPTILDVRIKTQYGNHEDITNKMRSVIESNWDTDVGNDNCPFDDTDDNELFGGVNVQDIVKVYPILSTAVVWIAYLFESDKKLINMSDEDIGKKIKYMLINFIEKSISRSSDLIKNTDIIVIGDIPF
jgi:hypothetical protein